MGSQYIDVVIPISVRKHKVDIERLQKCLRSHRKPTQQVAQALGVPTTMVEHWFRTDKHFSIPSPEIWLELKELLGITTDEFDKQVMEFEDKGGCYDQRNRVYVGDIAPTLTENCGNLLFLIKEKDE